MLARHRHIKPLRLNHRTAVKSLIAKLERHRKRAKRRFIRLYGSAAFTEESHRWQRFVRFCRANLLLCGCRVPRMPGLRSRRQQRLRDWMDCLQQELPALGMEVPGDAELRDLVRRGIRSNRRLVACLGLRDIQSNREILCARIFEFVAKRCQRLEQIPAPATSSDRSPGW
jgi:hypothetical protein